MDRATWVRRRDIRLNADCHYLPTNMMIGRMNATSILGSPTSNQKRYLHVSPSQCADRADQATTVAAPSHQVLLLPRRLR